MLQLRLVSILAMRGGDAQSTSEDDAGGASSIFPRVPFLPPLTASHLLTTPNFLCPCVVPLMRASVLRVSCVFVLLLVCCRSGLPSTQIGGRQVEHSLATIHHFLFRRKHPKSILVLSLVLARHLLI